MSILRQRVRTRRPALGRLGDLLVLLFALALLWYGLMTVLLAAKASPSTVNSISGYRTAYDFLAGLTPADLGGWKRAVIAGAGLLAFLVLGYAAWKALPRPYLARHDLRLADDERGHVTLAPRAVERLAETAAERSSGIAGAASRFGGDAIAVNVSVSRARDVADVLRGAQGEVRDALARHGLPAFDVSMTLTGYDAKQQKRELS